MVVNAGLCSLNEFLCETLCLCEWTFLNTDTGSASAYLLSFSPRC